MARIYLASSWRNEEQPFLVKMLEAEGHLVYDFRNPMNLPLPTIVQFDLPGNDATFGEWRSSDSLTIIDKQGVVHTFGVP